MTDIFERHEAVARDDDFDDIALELRGTGRELTFGFSGMWRIDVHREPAVRSGGNPTRQCPSCASQRVLVAVGPGGRRSCFCVECATCWHDFADCRLVLSGSQGPGRDATGEHEQIQR